MLILAVALAGGELLAPVRAQGRDGRPAGAHLSGTLDGMTFSGQVMRDGVPVVDVVDNWVFADGTFLSSECAVRCNYPRAPYFIRHVGDAIEFISESRCRDKDATIVWRGTIESGTIKGVMRWTISRWYWTVVKEFGFEGALVERAAAVTGK